MGAKPPHTHCHYCDTVARVDGGAACAGCGELPAPIAAKVQASVTKHLDRLESLTVAQLLDRCSKAKLKVSNIPKANESKQLPRKAEIIEALRHALTKQTNNTRGCRQGSRYDVHCNCGHPNAHQSKCLGIAPCPDCELCKRFCGIRHGHSTELIPRPTAALQLVQIDLKVCNTKSKRGNKYIVGIIDMKTTRSWTIPSPSNSAADLIRIFTHWKMQTIGNKPVGMIMTDNESWACSEEWTNAMDNMQIPQRKCGAYEHHQNGGVENLFRRANPLCGLYLASSSYFDEIYWDYAYVHAN